MPPVSPSASAPGPLPLGIDADGQDQGRIRAVLMEDDTCHERWEDDDDDVQPSHPGESLRDALAAEGWTVTEAASKLG